MEDSHVVWPASSSEDYRKDLVWGTIKLQFWNAGTSFSESSGAGTSIITLGASILDPGNAVLKPASSNLRPGPSILKLRTFILKL